MMSTRSAWDREAALLALSEKHLTDGRRRIDEQRRRITMLRQGGCDVGLAEDLLAALECTQQEWQSHHDLIAAHLAAIEAAERTDRSDT
ncbi:hypothetical protein [Methylobacterium sp. ID0610]|uniref:hypothetical protein n=1 Tax=Methylobacterium carpenticola TaxID=3344827 RepID=UPI00367A196D